MVSKSVPLGIYCRINLLWYSMHPFSHEEYEWAKNIFAFIRLAMSICSADSLPLSVVMDRILPIYGNDIKITISARALAFLPSGSFRAKVKDVLRSANVTIAPFPYLPTMVSISKSPGVEPFRSGGRSSIMVLFFTALYGCVACRFLCLSWCRQCFHRSSPAARSARIYQQTRFFSLLTLSANLMSPCGTLYAGTLCNQIGSSLAYAGNGLLLVLVLHFLFRKSSLKNNALF